MADDSKVPNVNEDRIFYIQKCYSLGSLFVGMTGGMALAHYTKIPESKPLYEISNHPQVKPWMKKIPSGHLFIGTQNMWVRLALQGLGCAVCYSYLECCFQRGHKRTIFDAALAGAITGGSFGLRGVPGGNKGAKIGAQAFAAYALIVQLMWRG